MKPAFMKNKAVSIIVIASIAILFSIFRFLPHSGIASKNSGKELYVSNVIDGDTIELSNGEKLRYIGIDTPETYDTDGSVWTYNPKPYAEEARDFNRKLVEGHEIRLEFDIRKRDKYNRLLAYVYVEDKMINLEMVRQGYAMIYTFPPNVRYIEEFLEAQRFARENKKGLWRDLEEKAIPSSKAKENIGLIKMVETSVIDTYLSDKVLILNCENNFKIAIFKNNLIYFPKMISRSPNTYFKYKTIKVYGIIKKYKGSPEIIVNHPSQLEIL